MIVRVAKTVAPFGKLDAEGREQSIEALGDPEPEHQAEDGSDQSDDERLEHDGTQHLTA